MPANAVGALIDRHLLRSDCRTVPLFLWMYPVVLRSISKTQLETVLRTFGDQFQ
jgi:hypothetical protein